MRPPLPEQLQGRLIELDVGALRGDRIGEVLELMQEFEEAVCVSFHVSTFGQGGRRQCLGKSQKRLLCSECDELYPAGAQPKSGQAKRFRRFP
jgi:hypothetical protein